MNIIIPLGGLGQRFKEDGYTKPKPLINIFGKEMIFHLLDNLKLKENDNLFIIYNTDLNKYSFNVILKNKYKNINLIELNKQTEGAAETILFGLNNISNELLNNKCILLDCDTFYYIDILDIYREQNNNSIFCFNDNQDKPIFSYLEINQDNIVVDIKEKIKISNYANTGCYCFKNGNTLKIYCKKIIDNNIREKGEYYVSCVIKEMLNDKHIFNSNIIKSNDFICVGTPLQLKIYCSNNSNNIKKKRFCFDLDKILVTSPLIDNDYSTVKPINKNIEYLNFLKNLGHYIIIYTSRGMKQYNGNTGLVMKEISNITFETLEKFGILYDEIYFGKPYADFYIDDLSINAYEDLEKQMGFYKTDVKERYFNDIISDKMDIIIKKSNNKKIEGEIYYYQNIPNEIKKYFPIFINNGDNWYSIEKINGLTLSYLYVNESLSEDLLNKYLLILNKIHYLNNINSENNDLNNINTENSLNIYSNYCKKIRERYNNFDYSKYNNSNIIYNKLIEYFEKYEINNKGIYGIIHGDPVFSNCIIDENNNLKLIDMRGKLDDKLTIFGDILYDYSKVYQSLMGYDEILFDKIISNDYKTKLLNIFNKFIIDNLGIKYLDIIKMICNSLLFTLIPLHKNDKCNLFYELITI
jgi:capsule biosynthesis phosphatase